MTSHAYTVLVTNAIDDTYLCVHGRGHVETGWKRVRTNDENDIYIILRFEMDQVIFGEGASCERNATYNIVLTKGATKEEMSYSGVRLLNFRVRFDLHNDSSCMVLDFLATAAPSLLPRTPVSELDSETDDTDGEDDIDSTIKDKDGEEFQCRGAKRPLYRMYWS